MLLKRNLLFKIIVGLIAFMMVFTTVYWVFAEGLNEQEMTANAIMLIDQDTGAVLYEKNPDAQIAPASTTKLLTAVVALEKLQLTDEVTVGAEVSVSGSLMGLKPGADSYGGDAAIRHVHVLGQRRGSGVGGENRGQHGQLRRDDEREGGAAWNEQFPLCHCFRPDWEGHYTTARDMAKLAQCAASNETIMKIAGTKTYNATTVDKTTNFKMESTNRLLYTPENKEPNTPPYTNFEYEYATGSRRALRRRRADVSLLRRKKRWPAPDCTCLWRQLGSGREALEHGKIAV